LHTSGHGKLKNVGELSKWVEISELVFSMRTFVRRLIVCYTFSYRLSERILYIVI